MERRPYENAEFIRKTFSDEFTQIRHLDYGGGNGRMTEMLHGYGWHSETYDPFPENNVSVSDLGRFNLITAFEVFEHVPDPNKLMDDLKGLMDEDCMVIFSTLVSDGHFKNSEQLDWWYASPRNGHISLYSKVSLAVLAEKNELRFASVNDNLHCFWNRLPSWAEKCVNNDPRPK